MKGKVIELKVGSKQSQHIVSIHPAKLRQRQGISAWCMCRCEVRKTRYDIATGGVRIE